MSVRIRLRRLGKKKHPSYRLAVVDHRVKRDGRFIEFVGFYDPMTEPHTIKLNEERIIAWLKKGASYSDTVGSLLRQAGVLKRWHEMKTSAAVGEKETAKPEKKEGKAKAGAAKKVAVEEKAAVEEKVAVEEKAAVEEKVEKPAAKAKEENKAEKNA